MPKKSKPQQQSILGGFFPISTLWETGEKPALFRSELSARWFLRSHREELAESQAIALHAGRLYVHLERFEALALRIAVRDAAKPTGAQAPAEAAA